MQYLQEYLALHAERSPDSIAVVLHDEKLTYGQLEIASNRLARMLKQQGCKKGDRVSFIIPRSPTALVTILGILKAGCIYTPIDPASPATRVAKIFDACGNRWVLFTHEAETLLTELLKDARYCTSISTGFMEHAPADKTSINPAFSLDDLELLSDVPLDYGTSDQDAAYILFTSGSTGIPKGVVITHNNVIAYTEWALKYFNLRSADKISGHIPLYFDLSVFDMFGTLSAGAQLHQVPTQYNLFPNKLSAFIRDSELTQWFTVPSTLNLMAKFDVVKQNDFPALKRVIWCGEVLPTPSLIYWMKRLPHVTFTNLYGPTEATIASSYYTVPKCPDNETAEIPIGTPCDGESLLVLDDRMQAVPTGEIGDLYIGGVGLSPGYWNDDEKTRDVFVNVHSVGGHGRIYKTGDLAKIGTDGLVYFVGRADSQIKSRGYRIELGEIEAALNSIETITEGAIVAVKAIGFEGATICCAYVAGNREAATPIVLRKRLSELLPDYMLPARWMQLDALPKNSNGKIDRPMLRQKFLEQFEVLKNSKDSSTSLPEISPASR